MNTDAVLKQFSLLEQCVAQEAKKVDEEKKLTKKDEEGLREKQKHLQQVKDRLGALKEEVSRKNVRNLEIEASVNAQKKTLKELKAISKSMQQQVEAAKHAHLVATENFLSKSDAMNDELLRAVSKYGRPKLDITLREYTCQVQILTKQQQQQGNEDWPAKLALLKEKEAQAKEECAKQEAEWETMQAAQKAAEEARTENAAANKKAKTNNADMYKQLEANYQEQEQEMKNEMDRAKEQVQMLENALLELDSKTDQYEQQRLEVVRILEQNPICCKCKGKLICIEEGEQGTA